MTSYISVVGNKLMFQGKQYLPFGLNCYYLAQTSPVANNPPITHAQIDAYFASLPPWTLTRFWCSQNVVTVVPTGGSWGQVGTIDWTALDYVLQSALNHNQLLLCSLSQFDGNGEDTGTGDYPGAPDWVSGTNYAKGAWVVDETYVVYSGGNYYTYYYYSKNAITNSTVSPHNDPTNWVATGQSVNGNGPSWVSGGNYQAGTWIYDPVTGSNMEGLYYALNATSGSTLPPRYDPTNWSPYRQGYNYLVPPGLLSGTGGYNAPIPGQVAPWSLKTWVTNVVTRYSTGARSDLAGAVGMWEIMSELEVDTTFDIDPAGPSVGIDMTTFTAGSPGTLYVKSTRNLPSSGGGTGNMWTDSTHTTGIQFTYTSIDATHIYGVVRTAGNGVITATGSGGSESAATNAIQSFMTQFNNLIKGIDSNHPTHSGLISSGQWGTQNQADIVNANSPCDVWSLHDYSGSGFNYYAAQAISLAVANNKPIFAGEVGFKVPLDNDGETFTPTTRAAAFKYKYNAFVNAGGCGLCAWNYDPVQDTSYNINPSDPVFALLKGSVNTMLIKYMGASDTREFLAGDTLNGQAVATPVNIVFNVANLHVINTGDPAYSGVNAGWWSALLADTNFLNVTGLTTIPKSAWDLEFGGYGTSTIPSTALEQFTEPVRVSPTGWTYPTGTGRMQGRHEGGGSDWTNNNATRNQVKEVFFEARGVSGVLDEIQMVFLSGDYLMQEQNGRIKIFLDDEDTPAVDLSVNDFFMYAEQGGPFTNNLRSRSNRQTQNGDLNIMNGRQHMVANKVLTVTGGGGGSVTVPLTLGSTLADYAQANTSSAAQARLFAPFAAYCRVEFVNESTAGDTIWGMVSALSAATPLALPSSYNIFTNDTKTAALLPPAQGIYTPVVGVNPTDVPRQVPITVCDLTGSWSLEHIAIAWRNTQTNTPDANILEGNFEVFIDGAARAQIHTTGTEDTFGGMFYDVAPGGWPEGQGGGDGLANTATWYRFFPEPIISTTELKIVFHPGDKNEGLPRDTLVGMSFFAGVHGVGTSTPNYRKIVGVTPGTTGSPVWADLFTGTPGATVGGSRVASDGANPSPSAWSAIQTPVTKISAGGSAMDFWGGQQSNDSGLLSQLPSAFAGADYWFQGTLQFALPMSPQAPGPAGTTHGVQGALDGGATSLVVGSSAYADLQAGINPNDTLPLPATTSVSGAVTGGATSVTLAAASGAVVGSWIWFPATNQCAHVSGVAGAVMTIDRVATFFSSSGGVQDATTLSAIANSAVAVVNPWLIEVLPSVDAQGTPTNTDQTERMIVTATGAAGASPWTVVRNVWSNDMGTPEAQTTTGTMTSTASNVGTLGAASTYGAGTGDYIRFGGANPETLQIATISGTNFTTTTNPAHTHAADPVIVGSGYPHSVGGVIVLWGPPISAWRQWDGYSEIDLSARAAAITNPGGSFGQTDHIMFKTTSSFNATMSSKPGYGPPQISSGPIGNNHMVVNIPIQMALLCRGKSVTSYFKFADDNQWQPVGKFDEPQFLTTAAYNNGTPYTSLAVDVPGWYTGGFVIYDPVDNVIDYSPATSGAGPNGTTTWPIASWTPTHTFPIGSQIYCVGGYQFGRGVGVHGYGVYHAIIDELRAYALQ